VLDLIVLDLFVLEQWGHSRGHSQGGSEGGTEGGTDWQHPLAASFSLNA
jgi:hypothetical protein